MTVFNSIPAAFILYVGHRCLFSLYLDIQVPDKVYCFAIVWVLFLSVRTKLCFLIVFLFWKCDDAFNSKLQNCTSTSVIQSNFRKTKQTKHQKKAQPDLFSEQVAMYENYNLEKEMIFCKTRSTIMGTTRSPNFVQAQSPRLPALIDKTPARIRSWTSKSLSYSGRLQLISSVLQRMYHFWCSHFILPSKVNQKIPTDLHKLSLERPREFQ